MLDFILAWHLFTLPVQESASILQIENEQQELLATVERSTAFQSIQDLLLVDRQKLDQLKEMLKKHVLKPPENAKLLNDGTIQPGNAGRVLDEQDFEQQYLTFLYQGNFNKIQVSVKPTYPKVTSEMISEIKDRRISSYVTFYPEHNKERTWNIKLAAKAIDSYVVFPGERFSFNEVVGERTEAKGYERAPVIIKGEFAEDVGGGICQVSSTLFNAVNLQGIEIVERYAHSRHVPYVPKGKDATVSWNGPDFVFKNTYNHPLLIKATAYNGRMAIHIYTATDAQYTAESFMGRAW